MDLRMHYQRHEQEELIHLVRFSAWGNNLRGDAMEYRHKMRKWCYAMFGNPDLDMRWHDNILFGEALFLHEEDAMLFLARWS
jgi:hypothetical protein